MRQTPTQALVTAFFASTLITIASGLGSAVYGSYVQHHDPSGEYGISLTSVPHPGTGQAAAVAGLGIFVAGCVAAALILAGWAQRVLGVTRFAAAVLGLVPLPALALPAIAIGAGGGWVAGFGLGLAMAVVAYGVLATGYAYGWARIVGVWANRRSRRG
jgi:hypothetical protein